MSNISHDSLSRVSSRSHDSDHESFGRKDYLSQELDLNPPVINIIESNKTTNIVDVVINNFNENKNSLKVEQRLPALEKPVESIIPLDKIPNFLKLQKDDLDKNEGESNDEEEEEPGFSPMSIKVILAQLESKIKPIVGDVVLPIIQAFNENMKESQVQLEAKIKNANDKIDIRIDESKQDVDK